MRHHSELLVIWPTLIQRLRENCRGLHVHVDLQSRRVEEPSAGFFRSEPFTAQTPCHSTAGKPSQPVSCGMVDEDDKATRKHGEKREQQQTILVSAVLFWPVIKRAAVFGWTTKETTTEGLEPSTSVYHIGGPHSTIEPRSHLMVTTPRHTFITYN